MPKAKTYARLCEDLGFVPLSVPSNAPIADVHAVDDVDHAAFDLTNPQNIQRLNAYLGDLGNASMMNPYNAINALWRRLLSVGIVFDLNAVSILGDQGVQALPIKQWGGCTGVDLSGNFTSTDGTRVPGGLSIVFRWWNFDGKYTVSAKIKPTGSALEEEAPANNMGGGAISGQPTPLGKSKKKRKIKVIKRAPPAT